VEKKRSADKNSYEENWEDYKKRYNLFLIVLFAFFPIAFALDWLCVRFFDSKILLIIASIIWLIGIIIVYFRFAFWECPKCKKPFFLVVISSFPIGYNFLTNKCLRCGLPKWAEKNE